MIPAQDFLEVSRHWRSVTNKSHDYDIIRNDSVFRAGFNSSSLFESQYRELQAMKTGLEEQYRNYEINEIFSGESVYNSEGSCFLISTTSDDEFTWPDPAVVRNTLMRDLTLVRGIGPIKANLLKKKGMPDY